MELLAQYLGTEIGRMLIGLIGVIAATGLEVIGAVWYQYF